MSKKLGKLIMLVGLPASGKSTIANELKDYYNAIILSSDSIREELYGNASIQDDHNKVFDTLHTRANELLNKGVNVIYDATNINRKRRIHVINNVLTADEYIAYYINRSVTHCLTMNECRERVVPNNVIINMYKSLQIPLESEGFNVVINHRNIPPLLDGTPNEIIAVLNHKYSHDSMFNILEELDYNFSKVFNLPHDSKYHTFSVSRHIYYVYDYIFDNYKGNRRNEMLLAALLHDIGKAYCKSFENNKRQITRTANFIGHEFVSAQLADELLYKWGYDENIIKYVTTLVQLHMIPHNMSQKQENKLRKLISEELFDDLMFLNEADVKAH